MPDRLKLPLSPEYLIDDILPSREVHLTVGPSGGGKTSWKLRMLLAFQRGETIFGHKSHPVPVLYVSLDRSLDSLRRTLDRLQIPRDAIPVYVPESIHERNQSFTQMLDAVVTQSQAKLIVIEGLASQVPEGRVNDYAIVSKFLLDLTRFCKDRDVTIIGVIHAAKTKENERYLNPRQRALGSVAWAAYTETIFLVEPRTPDNPEDVGRSFAILPRNAPEELYAMEFSDGLLVPTVASDLSRTLLGAFLKDLGDDANFTTSQTLAATKLSRSSMTRELKRAVEDGLIFQLSKGNYRTRRKA